MTSQVPTVAIDPKIVVDGRQILNRKNLFFCEEVGLPFYYSVEEMIAAYGDDFNARLKVKDFSPDYYERFRAQLDIVQATIAGEKSDWRAEAGQPAVVVEPSVVPLKKPKVAKAAKGEMIRPMTPERAAKREAKRAEKLALRAKESA